MLEELKRVFVTKLTSIGILQFPQYWTIIGYVTSGLGPICNFSGIATSAIAKNNNK